MVENSVDSARHMVDNNVDSARQSTVKNTHTETVENSVYSARQSSTKNAFLLVLFNATDMAITWAKPLHLSLSPSAELFYSTSPLP